ncbi:MAG TPA: hypothetical protein VF750_03070 [Sphingomicrobium sp.]
MRKALFSLALVVSTATAAQAAGVGPPIAYSIGREVYLSTADGSSIRLLYTGANRTSIFGVQLKPGGGEVAFEETACCSMPSSSQLKVVRFDANGTRLGTAAVTVCGRVSGTAYHPTDGSLLYASTCNQPLMRLDTATMATSPVGVPHRVSKASWLPNGTEFIYAAAAKIWRVATANLGSPSAVASADCVQSLDAGNSTDRALWTDGCAGTLNLLNLSTGQSSALRQGSNASFLPDDAEYAYLSPQARSGGYLLISKTDGSGTQTRIGSQAKYTAVDWRK